MIIRGISQREILRSRKRSRIGSQRLRFVLIRVVAGLRCERRMVRWYGRRGLFLILLALGRLSLLVLRGRLLILLILGPCCWQGESQHIQGCCQQDVK